MSKKVGRRKFIIATLFSGLSLYIGGWWAFKVRRKDATDIIIAVLRKRLAYLKLDQDGIEIFAREFHQRLNKKRLLFGSWAGILRPVYAMVDIFKFLPYSQEFGHFEEDIVTTFLLSSDFFQNGADISRTVEYRSLYNPYESGCENPFAILR